MARNNAENPLPQHVIDAANNNPFAQYEFGGLVEQAMTSPVPTREVTIVDLEGELGPKGGRIKKNIKNP